MRIVEAMTAGAGGVGPPASGAPTGGPSPAESPGAGRLGSGAVVDANCDILTALHVVAGATAIRLTFADGSTSAATVVSQQTDHDIAVLRATDPPPTFVPATLGNPGSVRVGDDAYLIGNPFGLTGGGRCSASRSSGTFRTPAIARRRTS